MFLVISASKTLVIKKNYGPPPNPPSYDENAATFSLDYCSVYLLWCFPPVHKQGIWVDRFLITFPSHTKSDHMETWKKMIFATASHAKLGYTLKCRQQGPIGQMCGKIRVQLTQPHWQKLHWKQLYWKWGCFSGTQLSQELK